MQLKKDNILETTEEASNTKKKNYYIMNWGKIEMFCRMKQRKYLNEMQQKKAEKLKRTHIEQR